MSQKFAIGRPSKKSTPLIDAICARLREGYSLNAASATAGVSPRTVYRWRARSDRFRQQLDRARFVGQGNLVRAGLEIALKTHETRFIAWLLERMFADEFGRRIEVSGPERGPIEHEIRGLSIAERRLFQDAIRRVREEYQAGEPGPVGSLDSVDAAAASGTAER